MDSSKVKTTHLIPEDNLSVIGVWGSGPPTTLQGLEGRIGSKPLVVITPAEVQVCHHSRTVSLLFYVPAFLVQDVGNLTTM